MAPTTSFVIAIRVECHILTSDPVLNPNERKVEEPEIVTLTTVSNRPHIRVAAPASLNKLLRRWKQELPNAL